MPHWRTGQIDCVYGLHERHTIAFDSRPRQTLGPLFLCIHCQDRIAPLTNLRFL